MEINDFIKNFADQWDETCPEVFTPNCSFRDLEEWNSLIGMAVINMIAKKYQIRVTPIELKNCITIEDLYNLIQNKQ